MGNLKSLLPQAAAIRDATVEQENTALRVGMMFVDLINKIDDNNADYEERVSALEQAVWPLDITLSASPLVIEAGKQTNVNLSWSIKRNGVDVRSESTMTLTLPEGPQSAPGSSKTVAINSTSPGTTTFKLTVTYKQMTKEVTATVAAVRPSYFGKVSASSTVDATAVTALAKILNSTKAMTLSNQTLSNQRLVYAYPKSFGALTSVKDGNNFETLTAYTRTELAIGGVDYYVYAMTTPVTASGVKQIYS